MNSYDATRELNHNAPSHGMVPSVDKSAHMADCAPRVDVGKVFSQRRWATTEPAPFF